MKPWQWVVTLVITVGAVFFTLAWWKLADKWADAEHKRFGGSKKGDGKEHVVIKGFNPKQPGEG